MYGNLPFEVPRKLATDKPATPILNEMDFMDELTHMYRGFNRSITWDNVKLYVVTAVVCYLFYQIVIRPWLSPLTKVPGQRIYIPYWCESKFFNNLLCGEPVEPLDEPITRYILRDCDALLLKGIDEIKHVLNSRKYVRTEGEKNFFLLLTGRSLLTETETEHTQMRKILTPSFIGSAIQNMLPIFQVYGRGLRDLWKGKVAANGKTDYTDIDIQDNLNNMTLDVICDAAVGYKLNCIKSGNTRLSRAFMHSLAIKPRRALSYVFGKLYGLVQVFPTKSKRQTIQGIKEARETVISIVDVKMKEKQKRGEDKDFKPRNLLESMLEYSDRHGLTREDLVDHVRTMMFAGHETTSTGLTWVLYALARNPEVQKKAREEVRSVLTDDDMIITNEHIEAMPYIAAVVKEGLRLYAPVPGLMKLCTADDKIGPYHVPAGTRIGVSFMGVHHNPTYWQDPEKFDPTRFLEPRCNDMNTWQYLPFSAGKHTCIGYRFALLESKVTLALVIRDLEFSEVPGFTFERHSNVTTKPDPFMVLRVRKCK